jgi:hypothetical protein
MISEMVLLTRKEKDIIGSCRLLLEHWWSRGRAKDDMTVEREIEVVQN